MKFTQLPVRVFLDHEYEDIDRFYLDDLTNMKDVVFLGHSLQLSTSPLHPQGSFLVYPIDSGDEEETDVQCQITNGIPKNSAIKVLVRVYIIKVPIDPAIYLLNNSLSLSLTQC